MKALIKRRILIKIILVVLLAATLGVYFSHKEQEMFLEFKKSLQEEIAGAVARPVTIKHISGGVFTPITLGEVEIAYDQAAGQDVLLDVERIKINKRIWHLFFMERGIVGTLILDVENAALNPFGKFGPQIKNQSGRIILDKPAQLLTLKLSNQYYEFNGEIKGLYDEPFLDMNLIVDSEAAAGHILVKGKPSLPSVVASLDLFGLMSLSMNSIVKIEDKDIFFSNLIVDERYSARGQFNIETKEASITVEAAGEEKMKLAIESEEDNTFLANLKLNHLLVAGVDLTGSFETRLLLEREAGKFKKLIGRLDTNTFILNYEPYGDISSYFTYDGDYIDIAYLNIGDNANISGRVGCGESKDIDMSLAISSADIRDMSKIAFIPAGFNYSAVTTCTVDVEGSLAAPHIIIRITSGPGHMEGVDFDSIYIVAEGDYPVLEYRDSRINRLDGFLIVEGKLDFRKFSEGNMFEDMVIKSDRQTIVWEGWDITKKGADSEVSLRKAVGDDFSLLYRGYLEDETNLDEEDKKDTLELQYEIFENKNLKLKINEEEEFFGLENKIKF